MQDNKIDYEDSDFENWSNDTNIEDLYYDYDADFNNQQPENKPVDIMLSGESGGILDFATFRILGRLLCIDCDRAQHNGLLTDCIWGFELCIGQRGSLVATDLTIYYPNQC